MAVERHEAPRNRRAVNELPKIPACHVCRNHHNNACPALWGGDPEPVEPERRG
ncbi:hypothetical protein ABZY58_11330 [Micromonospora tulbaghiae]|uniref:hypothetical protein n=1 Tax=Micromonospora tulbaghiae TaxID=479978 RepID=UPI0033A3B196